MKQRIELTKGIPKEILLTHIAAAHEEIKHFTAMLVFQNHVVSSGVFVNSCGYYGILTAHHVAKPLLEDSHFGLCIGEHAHALWVETKHCEHIPIGVNPNDSQEGPDLSFIIIRDKKLLATLQSLKSFSYLDTKDLEYFDSPLEQMNWSIAGAPHEGTEKLGVSPQTGPLVKYQHFIGEATYLKHEERNGFDFAKLSVDAGRANYPSNYEGMSGGGLWLIPLSAESEDPRTIRVEQPVLGGILFYQFRESENETTLTCHGHNSIYSRLRDVLREKNRPSDPPAESF